MLRFLERVRARPEHERARIAFVSAAGVTLLVFAAWVVSIGVRFSDSAPESPMPETRAGSNLPEELAGVGTLFSDLRDSIMSPPLPIPDDASGTPDTAVAVSDENIRIEKGATEFLRTVPGSDTAPEADVPATEGSADGGIRIERSGSEIR